MLTHPTPYASPSPSWGVVLVSTLRPGDRFRFRHDRDSEHVLLRVSPVDRWKRTVRLATSGGAEIDTPTRRFVEVRRSPTQGGPY